MTHVFVSALSEYVGSQFKYFNKFNINSQVMTSLLADFLFKTHINRKVQRRSTASKILNKILFHLDQFLNNLTILHSRFFVDKQNNQSTSQSIDFKEKQVVCDEKTEFPCKFFFFPCRFKIFISCFLFCLTCRTQLFFHNLTATFFSVFFVSTNGFDFFGNAPFLFYFVVQRFTIL